MFCKTLETKIFDFISAHALLERNDTVLVGLSGGPDSVLLAAILSRYIKKVNGSLVCCHVNHGLRGEASEGDEEFVKSFAAEQGMACQVRHVDVASYCREHGLSLEEAARHLRLDALEVARRGLGAQKIALGHTADDAVETFLFNLLRGTGRKGLSGIQPKRGLVVRPLLSIRRSEIIRYLKENRIAFRIDTSNWQCDFTRNYIRHQLFPHIEQKLKRKVKSNILQLISIIRSEEELLDRMTDELFTGKCAVSHEGITMRRQDFRSMDTAMQRRLIVRCFAETTNSWQGLNYREIDAIRKAALGKTSGVTFLYHGVRFLIASEEILIAPEQLGRSDAAGDVTLQTSDEVTFRGRCCIRTEVISKVNGDFSSRDCAYFDLEKLVLPLTLRSRRNGDAFEPFGMGHKKKVKELFIDEKVPFWERDAIPVISDAEGIIWIAGIRRAAVAKVDEHTKHILKIEKRDIG
jgi:tRNA(Ile)-lysidine synthase